MKKSKQNLGEILITQGLITTQQLHTALDAQKEEGLKLGTVLINLGFLSEKDLLNALAHQLKISFVDLLHFEFDPNIIQRIPETYARRHRVILLKDDEKQALVGMADPLDIYAYDELSSLLQRPFEVCLVKEADLLRTIDLVYRRSEEISEFAEQLSYELDSAKVDTTKIGELSITSDDAPVFKMLTSMFEDAVQVQASDIHIEPDQDVLRIRQRIDGVLHEQLMEETQIAPALTQRLKLMANLNIAEHRIPQDGRFNVKIKGHNVDVRLSTMPSEYGESVVMRLLDQGAVSLELEKTGMPADILKRLRKLLTRSYGMILVTGPTGSGKTTTLYAALNELNTPDKKIITVEDPVEYHLSRITQIQVKPQIDLTFSRVLRSVLRQDPDIILVGEIRDQETASIALRAAMTGHLVLATLHTNDAINSVIRLIDMGVESYLVASAMKGVLSQRLVRKICLSCIKDYTPTPNELTWLGGVLGEKLKTITFKVGAGCTHCNNTGYQGRTGVFELMEPDTDMLTALRSNDPAAFMTAAMKKKDIRPLGYAALDLAIAGNTTIFEVMRIASELEEEFEKIKIV